MNSLEFGALMAACGVVLTALTALIVAVVRKPVAVTDLWTENRSLRSDMDAMDAKFTSRLDTVLERTQILGDGFIALSDTVEEAKVKLVFTADRQKKIQAARSIIMDDFNWPTAGAVTA